MLSHWPQCQRRLNRKTFFLVWLFKSKEGSSKSKYNFYLWKKLLQTCSSLSLFYKGNIQSQTRIIILNKRFQKLAQTYVYYLLVPTSFKSIKHGEMSIFSLVRVLNWYIFYLAWFLIPVIEWYKYFVGPQINFFPKLLYSCIVNWVS